jgi:DNA-binding NarL/FixJ family response regulator
VIRVAIVDDHHAVRMGLHVAIRSEPGLVPVGAAEGGADLEPLLYRTDPDVVLLDYHLPGADGLTLCRRIKRDGPSPGVVLYSAFADPSMTVPAIVAGADAIVHKGVPARDLFDAIRRVARGEVALPPLTGALLEQASQEVDPEDLPILGMLVDHTPAAEVATTMRLTNAELNGRIERMLARLKVPVPPTAAPPT